MPSQNVHRFSDESFASEVLASERPVLVDFYADWCGPCHAVGPVIEKLAEQFGGEVLVGKLDIDASPETTRTYNVSSIPTVLLFKDGQVVETLVGVHSQQRYAEVVQQAGAAV